MEPSHLPPLDVIGPTGQRITLRALVRDVTVDDLSRCLDVETLWADRELAPEERLVDIDELRVGVRLGACHPVPGTRWHDPGDTVVEVAVVAGPSATSWRPLGPGRHLIGRSPHASVRLDDPSIELHHALLRVGDDRSVEVIQLTGAVPIRLDGRPWDGVVVDDETRFSIGASAIRIRRVDPDAVLDADADVDADPDSDPDAERATSESTGTGPGPIALAGPAGSMAVHASDPWRRVVWRAPHETATWSAPTIVAPLPATEPPHPTFSALIGTAVTAIGAVIIAVVMANPMFMLFAGMGVIAAVVTFIVSLVSTRRRRTRVRTSHAAELAAFSAGLDALHDARRAYHRTVHRTVAETLDEAMNGGGRVWQRRLAHPAEQRPDPKTNPTSCGPDGGILRAVVGFGTHRWNPPIDIPDRGALDSTLLQRVERCARLVDVAAPLAIRPGDAIAFHGAHLSSAAIARSIIVQLATWVGPADWQLIVVSSDRRGWEWIDWLPHGAFEHGAFVHLERGAEGDVVTDMLADSLDSIDTSRPTLLVTDEPQLFTTRTGPLRRFLTGSNASSLVIVDTDATVPAMCRRILTVGCTGSASWSGDVVDGDDAVGIEFVGISLDTADRVARRLSCLIDPEDDGGAGGGVAASISFAELMADTSSDAIARRWQAGGDDPAPSAPLGMSLEGRVDIDLVRDGPHGLIAGTTGAGKSELLRTLVLSLAASVGPQHLNFVLVDYKGGSTFDACTDLPHTVGIVTDLDDGLAERALVSLDAELQRRERILRAVGASDLTGYRQRRSDGDELAEPIARLVVVIDEFAALAKELPDFLNALVGIAQRGRSLGVHLLLATQRPAGVVNDDIRANTNLRLALRLHDRPDAVDVVGDELPATFPRRLPGRAALRLGPDELVVFQTARCTVPAAPPADPCGIIIDRPGGAANAEARGDDDDGIDGCTELTVVVESINAAAAELELEAPHRPWVDPLPFPLGVDELDVVDDAGAAIGWIDDPEHQRRRPLTWRPADGSLALIGSIGSGTTSTLIALAASTCGTAEPDDLHLYVIDTRGDDGLAALAALAHCGGVVRVGEDERLHRLLTRIVDAVDRRMGLDLASEASAASSGSVASSGSEPEVVVMIDGYASLRTSLGAIERQTTFELLQRVVNDGPAVGIAVVIADDGGTAITMVPVAHRWLFHLDDPAAARGFGLRSAPVAQGRPGRLRILGSGLEAQVARGAAGLAALPSRDDSSAGGPRPIAVLADSIRVDEIPPLDRAADRASGVSSVGRSRLLVGVDAENLGPAEIEVVDGDHLLVVGGPRTGVTTALARVVAAWESDAARRGAPFRIVRVGRRSPIDPEIPSDRTTRLLLVVDDAHRVDDPDLLAEIAQGEHPHVTVLAGARADAVRTGYGHWTREIAKSRCGIVMASRGDPDGDLLSVQIPRRPVVRARPGLAWVVDGGPLRQVQIAIDRD